MGGIVFDSKSLAFTAGALLAEHKAEDVVILDLRGIAGWTDFFVIASCNSSTHMKGLARFIEDFMSAEKIQPLNKPVFKEDESWLLEDMGDVIVHIMSKEARSFYELEKLWFSAPSFKIEAGAKQD